ncbi:hypothetical protein PSAC2689_30419 [Paraburkholderia sacchari]
MARRLPVQRADRPFDIPLAHRSGAQAPHECKAAQRMGPQRGVEASLQIADIPRAWPEPPCV